MHISKLKNMFQKYFRQVLSYVQCFLIGVYVFVLVYFPREAYFIIY